MRVNSCDATEPGHAPDASHAAAPRADSGTRHDGDLQFGTKEARCAVGSAHRVVSVPVESVDLTGEGGDF